MPKVTNDIFRRSRLSEFTERLRLSRCWILGNVVKNSFRQVQSCAEQTIGGIEIILRAPFSPPPKRLPMLREYRYYRPLYILGQWERIN